MASRNRPRNKPMTDLPDEHNLMPPPTDDKDEASGIPGDLSGIPGDLDGAPAPIAPAPIAPAVPQGMDVTALAAALGPMLVNQVVDTVMARLQTAGVQTMPGREQANIRTVGWEGLRSLHDKNPEFVTQMVQKLPPQFLMDSALVDPLSLLLNPPDDGRPKIDWELVEQNELGAVVRAPRWQVERAKQLGERLAQQKRTGIKGQVIEGGTVYTDEYRRQTVDLDELFSTLESAAPEAAILQNDR